MRRQLRRACVVVGKPVVGEQLAAARRGPGRTRGPGAAVGEHWQPAALEDWERAAGPLTLAARRGTRVARSAPFPRSGSAAGS
jgi:hypothetical protein